MLGAKDDYAYIGVFVGYLMQILEMLMKLLGIGSNDTATEEDKDETAE